MSKFVVGGLAIAGGVYLAKTASSYLLKKYQKEIKSVVIEKTVDFFFDDEEEESDEDILMQALNVYLKKKGAK